MFGFASRSPVPLIADLAVAAGGGLVVLAGPRLVLLVRDARRRRAA